MLDYAMEKLGHDQRFLPFFGNIIQKQIVCHRCFALQRSSDITEVEIPLVAHVQSLHKALDKFGSAEEVYQYLCPV